MPLHVMKVNISSQVRLGGPRANRTKMNPGEKEKFCSALGAIRINAGCSKDEKCVVREISLIVLCLLIYGKNMTVSAALTAVAALSDTKIISNMLFFTDITPRSLSFLVDYHTTEQAK